MPTDTTLFSSLQRERERERKKKETLSALCTINQEPAGSGIAVYFTHPARNNSAAWQASHPEEDSLSLKDTCASPYLEIQDQTFMAT